MNSTVYLNHANVLDEVSDSLGSSESVDDEEDDVDRFQPNNRRFGRDCSEGSPFRCL